MSSLVENLEHASLVLSGAVGCYLFLKWRKLRQEASQAGGVLAKAQREAEIILHDARLAASQEALKSHKQAEEALAARRAERLELERRLAEREVLINSQLERVVDGEKNLSRQKERLEEQSTEIQTREEDLTRLEVQTRKEMERVAGLSQEEARESFLKKIEQDALRDANTLSRHILEEARSKAEEKAKRIISLAIQRYAGEHTFENTTASIALSGGEDIKGRIIGREGRNIRAF